MIVANTDADVAAVFGMGDGPAVGACVGATAAVRSAVGSGTGVTVGSGEVVPRGEITGRGCAEPQAAHIAATAAANDANLFLC